MNKDITSRSAKVSDLDEINNLLKMSKSYWGYDEKFMNKYMFYYSVTPKNIKEDNIKVFLKDKEIIGFYSFILNKNEETSLYLNDFFIHPEHINQGLGKIMWLDCIEYASSINQEKFTLWSDPHSTGFYKKMGCTELELRESKIMKNMFSPIFLYKLKSE